MKKLAGFKNSSYICGGVGINWLHDIWKIEKRYASSCL